VREVGNEEERNMLQWVKFMHEAQEDGRMEGAREMEVESEKIMNKNMDKEINRQICWS
jgi:hypothetical protein